MRAKAIIVDNSDRILLGLNNYGLYALPGGKAEGEEHPVDTLLRELKEEIGLTEIEEISYLFELEGNKVFLVVPLAANFPTYGDDPDDEFSGLNWFNLENLPDNLEDYSEDIIYRFFRILLREDVATEQLHNKITAGKIDVIVDGKKVFELEDDTIWHVLPKIAQEQSKGKKVEYRQVLDDGTIVDQTPQVMPDALAGLDVAFLPSLDRWFQWVDQLPGGLADDKKPEDFDQVQLQKGIKVEMEHVDDKKLATEIAMDHLTENPKYYNMLEEIEHHVEGVKKYLDDIDNTKKFLDPNKAPKVIELDSTPANVMSDAVIEITMDGEIYKTCKGLDEYWDTVNDVLVLKDKGHKVEYHQLLKGGEKIDFTPITMPEYMCQKDGKVEAGKGLYPLERAKQTKKIYNVIDELLKKYIPEEKNRPSIEVLDGIEYFAKTIWRKHGKANGTQIAVNIEILDNDDLLRQVLAHECIHHHIYQKYGNEAARHGELFHMLADKVNAVEGDNFITKFANDTEFRENFQNHLN